MASSISMLWVEYVFQSKVTRILSAFQVSNRISCFLFIWVQIFKVAKMKLICIYDVNILWIFFSVFENQIIKSQNYISNIHLIKVRMRILLLYCFLTIDFEIWVRNKKHSYVHNLQWYLILNGNYLIDINWDFSFSKGLWKQINEEAMAYYKFDLNSDNVDGICEQFDLQKISLLRSVTQATGVQLLLREYSLENR